jgi:hypothetical protein
MIRVGSKTQKNGKTSKLAERGFLEYKVGDARQLPLHIAGFNEEKDI